MARKFLLPMAAGLIFTACNGKVPIVGLDLDQKEINSLLKEDRYMAELVESLNDVQDSVVPVLETQATGAAWGLCTFGFGVAIRGDVGIGSYRVGGRAGLRLYFAR